MQKLHLVGFTTDRKGLILSARRGARSGSFHLAVDQALAESVDELWAKQLDTEAERIEEAAARPARSESALSVREIQARLRQGRSVADIAKVAGVDASWVERFAPPVLAERAQVIVTVQGSLLRRARLGPSEQPIGEAIRRNLADRNVSLSPEEFSDAWSAWQLADGRWAVGFRYRYRNRDQGVRFALDHATGTIVAADRPSESLAFIAPATPREDPSHGPHRDGVVTMATSPAVQEPEHIPEEARKVRESAVAERARAAAAKKRAAAAKKRAAERATAKAEKQAADQARRAEAALLAAERRAAAARKAPTGRPEEAKVPPDDHADPGNGLDRERPTGEPRTRPLRAT